MKSLQSTQYDTQMYQKDIPNVVRVAPQGKCEWSEDKTCSSHAPIHVPCHPEKSKLCSCSQSNCSSHAVLRRFSLSFGTWISTKAPKSTRAGADQGQYWAMRGRDLLSWCYTNTKPTCSRRKPSTETSTASAQSRLNCQQLCLLNEWLIQALDTVGLHTAEDVYRPSSYRFSTQSYPSMHTYCILNTECSVYSANNINTLYAFATYNFKSLLSKRKSKAPNPNGTKTPKVSSNYLNWRVVYMKTDFESLYCLVSPLLPWDRHPIFLLFPFLQV